MRTLLGQLVLVAMLCSPALAVRWDFVETDLSLRPDGKATVVYKVAISPEGMALHGFYFQGYTGRPPSGACPGNQEAAPRRDGPQAP